MNQQETNTKIPIGDKLLKSVAKMLRDFIITSDHKKAISDSLANLAQLLHTDRIQIFSCVEEGDDLISSIRYEHVANGIAQIIDQNIYEEISLKKIWTSKMDQIFKQNKIISGNIEDFTQLEQKFLKDKGVFSIIRIPIFIEGKLWGFFAIDHCNHHYTWSYKDQKSLKILVSAIAGSILTYEQAKTLERQRLNLNQFFQLIDDSPIEIHVFNLNNLQYSYMNKTALTHLNYDEDEYKLLTPENILQDVSNEILNQILLPIINDTKSHIVDKVFHRRKDGSTYPVETHLSKMHYNDQEHMVAMAVDLSEKMIIQYKFDQQRKLFQDLFIKSVDAVFITKDGEFFDINDSTLKMFGYKKEEMMELGLQDIFDPLSFSIEVIDGDINKALSNAISDGDNRFEYTFKTTDSQDLWADVAVTEIQLEGIKMLHFVLRDITKRKHYQNMIVMQQNQLAAVNTTLNTRYEEELRLRQELEFYKTKLEKQVELEVTKNREKDRLLHNQAKSAQMGEMISMIAHQWRQPLNSISASAIALSMKIDIGSFSSKDIIKHTEFIENSTQQMSQTINDFMDFFKPEHEMIPFKIQEMINEILSIVNPQLKSRGIKLRYDKTLNIQLNGYRKELSHVLINLIVNSRDAYKSSNTKEKYIDLDFIDDDNCFKIVLKDYAGGIPKQNMDKIFNPYFTTKGQGEGTGIGLFMSKRIIKEVFKGELEFENISNGAAFTISIPKKNTDI